MSRYSLSPVQHIVQQHGRGEILARKVKAYSFFYLLDAKAAPFMCRLISPARQGGEQTISIVLQSPALEVLIRV